MDGSLAWRGDANVGGGLFTPSLRWRSKRRAIAAALVLPFAPPPPQSQRRTATPPPLRLLTPNPNPNVGSNVGHKRSGVGSKGRGGATMKTRSK